MPPPSLVGAYYLHPPPPPDARAKFLHDDLLFNGTCSVTGGRITYWGGGGGGTSGKDPKKIQKSLSGSNICLFFIQLISWILAEFGFELICTKNKNCVECGDMQFLNLRHNFPLPQLTQSIFSRWESRLDWQHCGRRLRWWRWQYRYRTWWNDLPAEWKISQSRRLQLRLATKCAIRWTQEVFRTNIVNIVSSWISVSPSIRYKEHWG